MSKLELFRVEVDRGLVEGVMDTEDLSVKAITTYQRQFYPDTDKSLLWMDEYSFTKSCPVFVLDPYNSLEEVNRSYDVGSDFRRAAIDKMMDQQPEASIKLSDQQASEILTAVSFHPKSIFQENAERFRESALSAS